MHKGFRMQVKMRQKSKRFAKKLSTVKSACFRQKGTYKRSYAHYPQEKGVKIIRFYGNFQNICFVDYHKKCFFVKKIGKSIDFSCV